MVIYSIHYRLDQEHIGASYNQRYAELQAAIESLAGPLGSHVDATSTVWIRSDRSGDEIAKVLKLAVDPRYDVVLVKPAEHLLIFAVGDEINPTQFHLETGIYVDKV